MVVRFPMRLTNPLNRRRGWRPVWREGADQRMVVTSCITTRLRLTPELGRIEGYRIVRSGRQSRMLPRVALAGDLDVTLTRESPVRFDSDALPAAFKHVRDGVADALGFTDDEDPRISWRYGWRKVTRGSDAVEIRIEVRGGADGAAAAQ